MAHFKIARNNRTTLYEVHASGCKHTASARFDYFVMKRGETGAEVAAKFEEENEGCATKLGPCIP